MMLIQIAILVVMPIVLTRVVKRFPVLRFIGPILLAYILGILLSNIPNPFWDRELAMSVSEIAVLISIPIVLMCTNLLKWFKLAKPTIIAFSAAMLSALIGAVIAGFIFSSSDAESWKISGMLVGCYTGGTPNLMAVGMALGVNSETLVLINTCDMFWGGLYFMLITGGLKNVYKKLLPAFDKSNDNLSDDAAFTKKVFAGGAKRCILNILLVCALAIVSVGISVGASMLITGRLATVLIFLLVSTCGVALSFWKKLHTIEGSWSIGQYFILLFSIALGGTIDIMALVNAKPTMLLYVGCVMMCAIVFHFILCRIFKIDADTAIITSTAAVYGPAFIGPVANAIDNRQVVVSGLISGLAGYAVGNYLGIGISYVVKFLVG